MFNSFGVHMSPSTVPQQRFSTALMAMSLAAIALAVFFPILSYLMPLIPSSGQS